MKRMVAKRIRKGTIRANVNDGVRISNQAPTAPPTMLIKPSRTSNTELSASSRRKPNSPPKNPGQSATVFVAFATLGLRPSHINKGKEMSVPPPAIEFMPPATQAPANKIVQWSVVEFIHAGLLSVSRDKKMAC